MLEIEAKSAAFLESSIKNFKIFIDTCSLMYEYADNFWTHAVPLLQREKKSIIVPLRVYEEVKKFADDPGLCARRNDSTLNSRAKSALKTIITLQKAGLIAVYGDKNDNFADNVFQTVFTQFRLKYNLMLITQDCPLAKDIIEIGNSRSVQTKNVIWVERLNKYGYMSRYQFGEGPLSDNPYSRTPPADYSVTQVPDSERFAFADTVRRVTGAMAVTSIPGEGECLTAERDGIRKPVRLAKAGPSGGEGTIFTTDIPDLVAKIYKAGKLDRAKFEKLKLMMTKSVNCEGVCFPLALLYNQRNEFVGYLMKEAKGRELQRCVFIPQLLKKVFPNWTKVDTVTLCITILQKLKYLHERNIILGDINPNNILVVSPKEVYFVDTDSYQIEGFPCPVGTINFTPPEIQRKEYSSFLRTLGNERFAVATLLFMIMLPGKPPYSLQGGENQIDNIINGDFAYASGSRSTGKAPQGMWRFCWSHLPRYLKDDFYETFHKDGQRSREKARYSTGDWLKKFENYLYLLTSGKLIAQDGMSIDIFPSRLKKNPKATYIRCRLCGKEVDEEKAEEGICRDCLYEGESYRCARCGSEIIYTNYQKYIKHGRKHEICWDCYSKNNAVYMTARCTVCGSSFDISNGERDFFAAKGYPLPKKCKNCRGQKANETSASSGSGFWSDMLSGLTNDHGKRCFITSAACEWQGKPDDCYELEALREFRDGWLVHQPGGKASIAEYYQIAPNIVAALNSSPNRDFIYSMIWERYIVPCVHMIEQGTYEFCRKHYEQMIAYIKQTISEEN